MAKGGVKFKRPGHQRIKSQTSGMLLSAAGKYFHSRGRPERIYALRFSGRIFPAVGV